MNSSKNGLYARLRRWWIEKTAAAQGSISREQIADVCECSLAQASSDIGRVISDNPGCLTYDMHAKIYTWTGKKLVQVKPRIVE